MFQNGSTKNSNSTADCIVTIRSTRISVTVLVTGFGLAMAGKAAEVGSPSAFGILLLAELSK